MEAFSDGVFAIAITILVLELSVPEADGDLLGAILDQWPSYLAYLVSFATVGAVWLKHSSITEMVEAADQAFLRLNLLLLMAVSFLPFPTTLMAENLTSDEGAERVAVTFYGVVLLVISLLLAALWRYAVSEGLVDGSSSEESRRDMTRAVTPSLGFYAAAIAVGLVAPALAVIGMLLGSLALSVPAGAIRRAVRPGA